MRILLAGLVALVSSHSTAGELPQEIRDALQKIGPLSSMRRRPPNYWRRCSGRSPMPT
jgi:hypothetical protein